ncbi:MAG TPA: serine/threonine-protein kinase [Gemmatimonadales bacterium]|nr:serine/threonine-protein kinase [Gemmatimonadales bacterium]
MSDPRPPLPSRFAVERELGRGGMGTVLLARDRTLGRSVAIKVLPPEVARGLDPERFAREIRVTAQLVHPNIVPLFDSGDADGWLFYVMPFIDGPTLRARLGDGPIPIPDVIRIVADTAEALAYAHAMGIVHRDVKPENIFSYGGRALLADFGIATTRDLGSSGPTLTATGTIIGTVSYMSPEQASGTRDLDGRSDLYSLGCVAYELLAGHPPFDRPTAVAILAAHLTDAAPPVRGCRPEVDPALCALVEQLLAKDPEQRPADASLVLEALRPLEASPGFQPAAPRPARRAAARATPPEAPEVLDLVGKARELYQITMQGGEGARDKLLMARVYAEKAVALAPGNAIALTTLADIIHLLAVRGFSESLADAKPKIQDLRMRALAADDSLGAVHFGLGTMFLYWEDDFEMAGSELALAVELTPDGAEAHRVYGAWLRIAGRLQEALEHMRMATTLAPKAPFMHVGYADVLMALGRYDEAVTPLRQALRLLPRYDAALERLEMSCHRAGRHDEALDARRMLLGVRGATDRIAMVTADAAEHGWLVARERDLRRELADLLTRAGGEDAFEDRNTTRQLADKIIIVLAELGEWTQAMDWVERAYHRRPGRLRRVLNDLPYDHHGLARDPRYARLLRTAGIEELLA